MAEYIDREKIFPNGVFYVNAENPETSLNELINRICNLPTADVVPKSEVERLQEALSKAEADVKNYMKVAEYQQNLSVKRYHEIKRLNEDVERLQEEIETFKDTNEHLAVLLEEAKQAYANYEETTGLKQAKQEVAREIFAEIDVMCIDLFGNFNHKQFAELKKKYVESEKC